jgi:hypothetical protein
LGTALSHLLLLGAGPSSYGFLRGLAPRPDRRVTIIAPTGACAAPSGFDVKMVSPKLRQPRVSAAYSHWRHLVDVRSTSFFPVGMHGVGGAAQFWGAAVSFFSDSDLHRLGLAPSQYWSAVQSLSRTWPISGNQDDEFRSEFACLPVDTSPIRISDRIEKLFGSYHELGVKVGRARISVHQSGAQACSSCGKCLSGCPTDSIWAPKKGDFLAMGHDVSFVQATAASFRDDGRRVSVTCNDGKSQIEFEGDDLVLAVDPVNLFRLLTECPPQRSNTAQLFHNPAYGFVLYAGRRPSAPSFGMAQGLIRLETTDGHLYGSLYDGSVIRSASRVFLDSRAGDRIAQFLAPRFIFGSVYLSSDRSTVTMQRQGRSVSIEASLNPGAEIEANAARLALRAFASRNGLRLIAFRRAPLGADAHYAGGVPKSLRAPEGTSLGTIRGVSKVRIVGGGLLNHLPSGFPTISLGAAAFCVGRGFGATVGH